MKNRESTGRQASPPRELGLPEHGLDGAVSPRFADGPAPGPGEGCQRSGALNGLEWKNCASGVGSKTGTGWKPAVVSP